jgi:diphthamide biosynthesis protein 4
MPSYAWDCRCSGSYIITESELEQGYDVVNCSTCSLAIRVLYEHE